MKYFEKKIISKIMENLNYSNLPGMIIASPSNYPPYKYHWIRDSALVVRVLIDLYKKNNSKYFIHILNYIENEFKIQNLDTKAGLGEPKIRIDCTPYNEPWGRPQNDGPALRGINMINIYKILKNKYSSIVNNLVVDIIKKDLVYTLDNLFKPSFDLWEEVYGWNFYTRMVQLKFIKDYIRMKDEFDNHFKTGLNVNQLYLKHADNILHHIDNEKIISSFDEKGNIIKVDDGSIFLAFCHIDFDVDILKLCPLKFVIKNIENMHSIFRKKYNNDKVNLIGRYENDKYFDGHTWIICSLALVQVYIHLDKKKYKNICNKIFEFVKSIDINLDLDEQYDFNKRKMLSAEKLTWNYSELYFTNLILSNINI